MELTLNGFQTQLGLLLQDEAHLTWSMDELEAALRLALGEYNLSAPQPAALAGLDGASLTTLPAHHASLLLVGAAGFAAAGRSTRLSGLEQPPAGEDWSAAQLSAFRALLARALPSSETQRLARLHSAAVPPWTVWEA
ncbi:MAG TPA: hypothetical protein PKW33_20105 [Anaerolineaceae bacterium]|nr:hypothetical protein [Anaerolineaceae bacterium]HPN53910.1 hypothetical protein [Anaerolineaceae bacterium]